MARQPECDWPGKYRAGYSENNKNEPNAEKSPVGGVSYGCPVHGLPIFHMLLMRANVDVSRAGQRPASDAGTGSALRCFFSYLESSFRDRKVWTPDTINKNADGGSPITATMNNGSGKTPSTFEPPPSWIMSIRKNTPNITTEAISRPTALSWRALIFFAER